MMMISKIVAGDYKGFGIDNGHFVSWPYWIKNKKYKRAFEQVHDCIH